LAAPVLAVAALSVFLWSSARAGWRGAVNPCVQEDGCYCERWRVGPVRQPANTWSCLAFVAAGLLCAAHASRNGNAQGGRMSRTALYPALFSTGLVLIGPASMALHASMTEWGGKLDGASMDFFIAFAAAFGLSRRFRWGERRFLAALSLGTAVPVAVKFLPGFPRGEVVFGLLVAVFAFNELLPEGETGIRPRSWLKASAGCFFSGFAVWALSRTSTGPLCAPDSLLQGHAVWHVLTAMAAGALYPHFLGEPA
jgi:hypothetical protein